MWYLCAEKTRGRMRQGLRGGKGRHTTVRFKSDSAIQITKSADSKTSLKTPMFLRSPGQTRRSTLFEFRVAPFPSLGQNVRARVNAFLPKRWEGCDTKPGRGGYARGGRLARLWQPNERKSTCVDLPLRAQRGFQQRPDAPRRPPMAAYGLYACVVYRISGGVRCLIAGAAFHPPLLRTTEGTSGAFSCSHRAGSSVFGRKHELP